MLASVIVNPKLGACSASFAILTVTFVPSDLVYVQDSFSLTSTFDDSVVPGESAEFARFKLAPILIANKSSV